jgi:hypothetical protein
MRVTRRIRPSQVGCGATIGRRRLYAASASTSDSATETLQISRLSLIIQPDGQIISPIGTHGLEIDSARPSYASAPELAGSSARGL